MPEKKEKASIIDYPINHSKKIITGLVCITLLATVAILGAFGLKGNNGLNNPVVAEVGGDKIYLKEYKERLFATTKAGTPEAPIGINETIKLPILSELVDIRIIENELSSRGIALTEGEITEAAKKTFGDYARGTDSMKEAYKNYVKFSLGKEKLAQKAVAQKEGFVLYCRYDLDEVLTFKGKESEAAGLRNKQKTYATDYCQKSKERLEKGTTDYTKEMEALKADTVIGRPAWGTTKPLFGLEFNKNLFVPNIFNIGYDDYDQIKNLKKPGYSILTVSMKDVEGIDNSNPDKTLALVYIKDAGTTGDIVDLNLWIENKRKESNTKIYAERIKI